MAAGGDERGLAQRGRGDADGGGRGLRNRVRHVVCMEARHFASTFAVTTVFEAFALKRGAISSATVSLSGHAGQGEVTVFRAPPQGKLFYNKYMYIKNIMRPKQLFMWEASDDRRRLAIGDEGWR